MYSKNVKEYIKVVPKEAQPFFIYKSKNEKKKSVDTFIYTFIFLSQVI